ncbi:MAG: hypothetical protein N2747_06475 [Chitinophagaceae bacterium]|nr:hypothetical protein [Chitinophagaceae bacterium]
MKKFNVFKRYFGLVFLFIAPLIIYELVNGAVQHIRTGGNKDIHNPVVWVIILAIFTPVAIGLVIFGWYAYRGEYDWLPEKSQDLDEP